jgi:hypothetical protein
MNLLKTMVIIALTLEAIFCGAQTETPEQKVDRENNERYWIYRDRFRKKFVNIGGKEDGQSIPFIQFKI